VPTINISQLVLLICRLDCADLHICKFHTKPLHICTNIIEPEILSFVDRCTVKSGDLAGANKLGIMIKYWPLDTKICLKQLTNAPYVKKAGLVYHT